MAKRKAFVPKKRDDGGEVSGSLLDRRAESGSLIIDDSEDVSLAVSTPKKAKGRCKKPFQSNKQLNRLLTQYDYVLYAMQPSQSKQDIHEMFCLGQVHFVIEHQTNHSADNLSTFGISNNSANVAYIGCQKEEPSCDILLNESGMVCNTLGHPAIYMTLTIL